MRVRPLLVTAACLLAVTGCAATERQTGEAAPASSPARTSSHPSSSSAPSAAMATASPYATGSNGLPVHLASVWLAADQYTLASSIHWTLSGISDDTQEAQGSYACQAGTTSMRGLGMRSFQTRTADNGSTPGSGYQGGEQLFFFPDPTIAGNAYSAMVGDMSGCQARETADAAGHHPVPQVIVSRTATVDAGSAWIRQVTTREYVDDNLEDHTLIVARGRVVAVVSVYWNQGSHPTYDYTDGDTAVLQRMAGQLCQYGGSC